MTITDTPLYVDRIARVAAAMSADLAALRLSVRGAARRLGVKRQTLHDALRAVHLRPRVLAVLRAADLWSDTTRQAFAALDRHAARQARYAVRQNACLPPAGRAG